MKNEQVPNQIARAVAVWASRFIEKPQVVLSFRSGAAQLWGR